MKLVEKDKPDIILLDIRMPVMDGIETLRALREKRVDTITIMVTADEDAQMMDKASELGAREYIHKPLVLGELASIVENYARNAA